ncbi:HNH endonuclease signature motif containing protein [Amycolatopsis minnesotensis]|uniref:HNH endonuclease signature motif containing protein n=1 Tax=Amycolatopsis minnesotensis TaxID=337894 RepID=UPI003CD0B710
MTGLPVDLGRENYRPPSAMRKYLHVTHRTCSMPGCNRPAQYTDLDHAQAWKDGGGTDKVNLRPLCRVHHVLRGEPGWTFLHHQRHRHPDRHHPERPQLHRRTPGQSVQTMPGAGRVRSVR